MPVKWISDICDRGKEDTLGGTKEYWKMSKMLRHVKFIVCSVRERKWIIYLVGTTLLKERVIF